MMMAWHLLSDKTVECTVSPRVRWPVAQLAADTIRISSRKLASDLQDWRKTSNGRVNQRQYHFQSLSSFVCRVASFCGRKPVNLIT